jgi:hypothetical protein
MKNALLLLSVAALGCALAGCSDDENPLLDYEGERSLIVQEVTVSHRPDVRWVGGRVAAVGINRGPRAALDTSLVWLRTAGDNSINSYVTVGEETDLEAILQYGGTALDSLPDNTEYTLWLAEESALEAGLNPAALTESNFADTTFTLRYVLQGRVGGDEDFISDIDIVRNQTLLSDEYRITWVPATTAVRAVAIREASQGAFTDLIWHVVIPEGEPGGISSPLVIGQEPADATVVVAFPETGFNPVTHTLWMVGEGWNGSFALSAPDYAFFQIFDSNFE